MADTKVSALTADTTPTGDDELLVINDPGGTPAERRVTITNMLKLQNTFAKAVKSADETLDTDTTLQNDDDLLLALSANKVYHIQILLFVNSPSAANFKMQFTLPSGASGIMVNGDWQWASLVITQSVTTADTVTTTGNDQCIASYMTVTTTGTPGNITLQWAQNISDGGTTTVKAGSMLVAWEE